MGFFSNKISRDKVKPGDHIYSWRRGRTYTHHGIYVGDGKVIHFTRGDGQETGSGTFVDMIIVSFSHNRRDKPPCPNCGVRSSRGGVISSCLECFLSGGDLYVFQYNVSPAMFLAKPLGGICTTAPSDPPEKVIYRANYLLQSGFGVYNVFKHNCEDFAIYCKTELILAKGMSGQTTAMATAASVLLSPLWFGALPAGYGMYCVGRLVSDISQRRAATRSPVERVVADMADNSEMEAKPVADVADKSEMEAKPEDKKIS